MHKPPPVVVLPPSNDNGTSNEQDNDVPNVLVSPRTGLLKRSPRGTHTKHLIEDMPEVVPLRQNDGSATAHRQQNSSNPTSPQTTSKSAPASRNNSSNHLASLPANVSTNLNGPDGDRPRTSPHAKSSARHITNRKNDKDADEVLSIDPDSPADRIHFTNLLNTSRTSMLAPFNPSYGPLHCLRAIIGSISMRFSELGATVKSYLACTEQVRYGLLVGVVIVSWGCFNLSVSVMNKMILPAWQFPITLTMLHMWSCTICSILSFKVVSLFRLQVVSTKKLVSVGLVAVTASTSIVFGNFSLEYNALSYDQMIGATTPFFTAVFSFLIMAKVEKTVCSQSAVKTAKWMTIHQHLH